MESLPRLDAKDPAWLAAEAVSDAWFLTLPEKKQRILPVMVDMMSAARATPAVQAYISSALRQDFPADLEQAQSWVAIKYRLELIVRLDPLGIGMGESSFHVAPDGSLVPESIVPHTS